MATGVARLSRISRAHPIVLVAVRFSRRLIAPGVLIAVIVAIWALGLPDFLSWSGIERQHAALKAWVESHVLLAPLLFLLIYITSVTLSLPQAGLLTMIGGLFFGVAAGGALAVTGATTGALFLFLIARSAFGAFLSRRAGGALETLRDALRRDGFSYLLAIRLLPIVPFWLTNLAAAACGMPLRPFVLATLIGIMPVTFVTAWIGAGLGQVLARGETPDFGLLFSWPILGPLVAMALLSLTPVIWRKWRGSDA
jgi:uncharacterized membrane protein YdjX (TVP38/TMEM64 family)